MALKGTMEGLPCAPKHKSPIGCLLEKIYIRCALLGVELHARVQCQGIQELLRCLCTGVCLTQVFKLKCLTKGYALSDPKPRDQRLHPTEVLLEQ